MKTLTFKQFISDYEEYYQEKLTTIRTESDMQEILYNIYDTDSFEMDYENKLIELY
jgi:hypothetical protein